MTKETELKKTIRDISLLKSKYGIRRKEKILVAKLLKMVVGRYLRAVRKRYRKSLKNQNL